MVRPGAVFDQARVLVRRGHPRDRPAGAVRPGARRPVVRGLAKDRPGAGAQPVAVSRGGEVLPEGQRHVAGDVPAVSEHLRSEGFPAGAAALPGEARAREAFLSGVRPRAVQRAEAILEHRARQLRVLRQQGRQHPALHVPEHVSAEGVAAQAHRGHSAPVLLPDAAQHVEHAGASHLLRLRVPLDLDVPLPEAAPGGAVRLQPGFRRVARWGKRPGRSVWLQERASGDLRHEQEAAGLPGGQVEGEGLRLRSGAQLGAICGLQDAGVGHRAARELRARLGDGDTVREPDAGGPSRQPGGRG